MSGRRRGGPRAKGGPGRDGGPKSGRGGPGSGGGGKQARGGGRPRRGRDGDDRSSPDGTQVEGRHAVREALIGPRRVREVVMAAGLDHAPILDDIRDLAADNRLSVTELGRGAFDAASGTESAQGVMARVDELVDHDADVLARGGPEGATPFLVVLDGVTDPGNLGAVLRSADGAGVTGVILPRHRAARVSPTVTKAAAGAIEHLPIATVAGIPAALARLRELGVWVVGLDEAGDEPVWELAVATEPVAVVLGAEGTGLSRLARERCDVVARVPLAGHLDSLNVSAAAAVALFAIARARSGG